MKALWDSADISRINSLIVQMNEKQGETLISKEVKCLDEIKQLEHLLALKHERLKEIWDM